MATCCVSSTTGLPNILIRKNVDFILDVEVLNPDGTPVNLTGFTAESQIRNKKGGTLLEEFACTIPDPSAGSIRIFLSQPECAALTFTSTAYYDLVIVDGSTGLRYWVTGGTVSLDDGVTT